MAEVIMSPELYRAAMEGNVSIFTNQRVARERTTSSAANSSNAAEADIDRYGNKEAVKLLVGHYKNNVVESASEMPWRVKLQGDTPLHVALKRGKTDVGFFLINLDDDLASIVNHSDETPLHLAGSISTGPKNGSNSTAVSKAQEELLRVIVFLLRKASSAASKHDVDALTPILRASSCRNRVPVILVILDHNPQLAEQRDLKGRTVLHLMKLQSYEEWKRALKIPVIKALKDEQDFDGNSPLHLAIQDSDFLKVRIFKEYSADFRIKNRHGFCAWELIETQDGFLKNLKDETDRAMNGLMKKELYKAAVEGNTSFLSQHEDIYLVSRSMNGNNILHIAMSPESVDKREFVEVVLERLPSLLCRTNAHGDTPLHLAARRTTLAAFMLMILSKNSFEKASEAGSLWLECPPWQARDSEGNTPLHEALLAGNALFARFLIQIDNEVAWYVNNSNETPLHLCARYKQVAARQFAENTWPEYVALTRVNELDLLLSANISAAFLRDVDGFTPLLRAAQSNQRDLVTKILHRCPRSAEVCDFDGQTLLHHLPLTHERDLSFDGFEVRKLIMAQDYGGNMPLHVAIKNRNFRKVKILVQGMPEYSLLEINNEAESAVDLMRSQTEVPEEIRQLFQSANSHRSLYGISETETKENVSTLLVMAVLLATITFAAAFTVPGGFDQNKGTPILIKRQPLRCS